MIYGTRAGEESENSLVIRSIGDFGQSIVAAWNLVREGLINPVKRELRYVIESTVKYLYVDQQIRNGATIPKLPDRLDFLFARPIVDVPSIDMRTELELGHPSQRCEQFVDELYDAYRTANTVLRSRFAPPDRRVRMKLDDAGQYVGTTDSGPVFGEHCAGRQRHNRHWAKKGPEIAIITERSRTLESLRPRFSSRGAKLNYPKPARGKLKIEFDPAKPLACEPKFQMMQSLTPTMPYPAALCEKPKPKLDPAKP